MLGSNLAVTTIRNRHPKGLSDREAEVCALIAKALTSKQIAKKLGISHRTVDFHAARILIKYEVQSRHQLLCMLLTGETPK